MDGEITEDGVARGLLNVYIEVITDGTLNTYYEQIRNKEDAYSIRNFIVKSQIEQLFETPEEAAE